MHCNKYVQIKIIIEIICLKWYILENRNKDREREGERESGREGGEKKRKV